MIENWSTLRWSLSRYEIEFVTKKKRFVGQFVSLFQSIIHAFSPIDMTEQISSVEWNRYDSSDVVAHQTATFAYLKHTSFTHKKWVKLNMYVKHISKTSGAKFYPNILFINFLIGDHSIILNHNSSLVWSIIKNKIVPRL